MLLSSLPDEYRPVLISRHPIGRLGKAEEVVPPRDLPVTER
jgi:hypothetical protein